MQKASFILAILCFTAAIAMESIGASSTHLSELKDYFWVPLVPGIMFAITGFQNKR